jgi:hypothetical protein
MVFIIFNFFFYLFLFKINKIFDALQKAKKDEGLYYNYMNPSNGEWCGSKLYFLLEIYSLF